MCSRESGSPGSQAPAFVALGSRFRGNTDPSHLVGIGRLDIDRDVLHRTDHGLGLLIEHRVSGHKRLDARIIAIALISEEHTSELQSLMRISYAVFCLKKTTVFIPLIYTPTH